jgi:hypothetical protein
VLQHCASKEKARDQFICRNNNPKAFYFFRCVIVSFLQMKKSHVLKGHGNEADFLGFCINQFGIGPLHYISSRSDFDFEFAAIFVIEKRLPDSPSREVNKNAYRYKCFQTFESINGVSTLQPRLIFG